MPRLPKLQTLRLTSRKPNCSCDHNCKNIFFFAFRTIRSHFTIVCLRDFDSRSDIVAEYVFFVHVYTFICNVKKILLFNILLATDTLSFLQKNYKAEPISKSYKGNIKWYCYIFPYN